ncbi:hypothetical protein L1049_011783 [Liquidambar formosana]|uniref:RRM domain-containing protein n=1 Tax=Liquidambar formosana TaxID=63359 RepID=A0AAP0RS06_LIQFO
MRRSSPQYYSPPRRGYGGRGRSPPRRGYGGHGRRKDQNHGSLLVRNIPLDCRPEELRVPFERFGLVRDVYLPKDYYTGEPRGFAFVQFVDPYEASEAQYHMNGQFFAGREISVVLAAETRKRPEEMRSRARVRGPSSHGGRRSSYYGKLSLTSLGYYFQDLFIIVIFGIFTFAFDILLISCHGRVKTCRLVKNVYWLSWYRLLGVVLSLT